MEPERKLLVLPSNAPTNLEHHSSARGVLQITSGNVQSSTLENVEVKSDASSPTAAKAIRAEYPSQASITPSRRTKISASRSRAPLRGPFRGPYVTEEGRKLTSEQIRWLNERLATSGGFPTLTRSELESEAYLKYRGRVRKNLGKDGKPVWSDHMEEAFQRGKWAPSSVRRRALLLTRDCSFAGVQATRTQKARDATAGKAAGQQ